MGWHAIVAGPGEPSAALNRLREDFARCGVDYLAAYPTAVPVILQELQARGRHRFRYACPHCGQTTSQYRRHEEVATLRLDEGVHGANVFFVDRLSSGVLELARRARMRGGFIAYEPSDPMDGPWLEEMLGLADLVKVSDQREADLPPLSSRGLQIHTRGADGLRWRWLARGHAQWQSLPAMPAARVIDTCGAGDWLTAGILMALSEFNMAPSGPALIDALMRAQALAAWSCGFAGARGALYRHGPEPARQMLRQDEVGHSVPRVPLRDTTAAWTGCLTCSH
jgi:fructokinase